MFDSDGENYAKDVATDSEGNMVGVLNENGYIRVIKYGPDGIVKTIVFVLLIWLYKNNNTYTSVGVH
jgi:hypothetical protein